VHANTHTHTSRVLEYGCDEPFNKRSLQTHDKATPAYVSLYTINTADTEEERLKAFLVWPCWKGQPSQIGKALEKLVPRVADTE